ncbi:uncharacterized protein BJ171DRAFT_579945 [Polychytrium aggregatum]|uniref:uncharacterized protein n=1 Tax=Polychytrium aggregatum TaxID=110093 RepID=UPI0022FEF659|nr:uncharacterized protein BJ171DRAFT_579945 [Polychytrium aggregatum]KAI9206449.1 hypothetical protein BJ171DRAFT_579945 [Polychytrium aggregatum]
MGKLIVAATAGYVLASSALVHAYSSNPTNFLNAHNKYRYWSYANNVQWSSTLQQHAQNWANHLASTGGSDHGSDLSANSEGENLSFYWVSTGANINQATGNSNMEDAVSNGWFSEWTSVSNWNNVGFSESTGHFTQLAWKATTTIGCAAAQGVSGGWDYYVYVCRYQPPGNIIGAFQSNLQEPNVNRGNAPSPGATGTQTIPGCFYDGSSRVLTSYQGTTSSPSSCSGTCASNGYKYYGVENGNECWCDNQLSNVGAGSGDGAGTVGYNAPSGCNGANGGAWRIYIQKASAPAPTTQNIPGCFYDGSSRVLTSYQGSASSASACSSTCASKGYKLYGVENSNECWCDNQLSNVGTASGVSGALTGYNAASGCSGSIGGAWTIYINNAQGSSPAPAPTVPGCFWDASSRVLTGSSSTASGRTQCSSNCASGGFKYYGFEYGSECYCGNQIQTGGTAGDGSSTRGSSRSVSDCNNNAGWAIYIDLATGSSGQQDPGCYYDNSNRILQGPSQIGNGIQDRTTCKTFCTNQGYLYYGYEYGDECYCGNSISSGGSGGSGAGPRGTAAPASSCSNAYAAWMVYIGIAKSTSATIMVATGNSTVSASGWTQCNNPGEISQSYDCKANATWSCNLGRCTCSQGYILQNHACVALPSTAVDPLAVIRFEVRH